MRKLTDLARRKPVLVTVVAVLLTAVAAVYGGGVEQKLDPYGFKDPQEERVRAAELIEDATGVDPQPQIVVLVRGDVDARSTRETIADVKRIARKEPAVGRVAGPGQLPSAVASDGDAAYVLVYLRASSEGEQQENAVQLTEEFSHLDGVTVGGEAIANAEVERTIEQDLKRAELIAFPIIFLLSVWFFRGLVAALLPPIVGALTIMGTLSLLALAAEFASLSVFALNLVTGLGLGLAIDYTLFITSRYREELARHGPGREALLRTLLTAGKTVLFSALTVAGALASLLVFPQRFLFSMGVGGVIVPLLAALISLVLLPAILVLLGQRVNAGAPRWLKRAAENDARPATEGGWYRLSQLVMRRPVIVALAAGAVMLAAAAPALEARFTQLDARVLPQSTDARQVFTTLREEFPGGLPSPITVVVRSSENADGVASFSKRLGQLQGVTGASRPRRVGEGLWRIELTHPFDPLSERAQDLVRKVREAQGPTFLVTGEAAAQIDQKQSISRHLPIAFAILAAITFLLLLAMTRAPVLAAKQVVMNVLVVGAAFGVSVFVFQEGRLESLLGYESVGALELSQPLLIIAIVFGLSTDYGVFLFSRIIEARRTGQSNREAVALGLERSGRIVTAAALLFSVAMAAIATSEISYIKQLAVAVTFAVLIDAFVVRALLVPSLMRLLGRYNWWAPGLLALLQRPGRAPRHERQMDQRRDPRHANLIGWTRSSRASTPYRDLVREREPDDG